MIYTFLLRSCYYLARLTTSAMGTDVIWWSAISLEVVVLVRGVFTGLLRKYPFFYTYIGCVVLKEIIGLLSSRFGPNPYIATYWPAELATIVASYAVLIEIIRQTFRHDGRAARLSQKLLLTVLLFTFFYIASGLFRVERRLGLEYLARATMDLGRDLRYIEGTLLLVLLLVISVSRISIGRNLLGLILGYSFWVGLNVMNFAFWFQPGKDLSDALRTLIPLSYVVTLILWCAALWSSKPEPVPPSENVFERDYEPLAAKTKAGLANASSRLARTLRP